MRKIVGIIAEYNPLHNGHIHHINEIKKQAKPDVIISVISSSITMRGDLSIFDKFTKAKQALDAGTDVVIELPFVYTMQRADIFALNSVKLLNLLGCNEIWIGSENNNVKLYESYYNDIKQNINNIEEKYSNGISYKNAYNINFKSNDILGYSYYKAIKDNNLNIELHTIQRKSSDYLDNTVTDETIASALAIRNNIDLLESYTPSFVFKDKDSILDEEMIFPFIKYKILSSTLSELKSLFFCDEGIEYKLKDISKFNTLDDFVTYLSTKRYTKTRIKRMLIYILFNVKKEEINHIYQNDIEFIRVLGYTESGKSLLNECKKNLTIYTNIKDGINLVLDIEMRVSKILDGIYNTNLLKQEQKGPILK